MGSSLSVLHVIPSLSPSDGGPTTAMLAIEHALCAAGLAVTTLTTSAERGKGGEFSAVPGPPANAERVFVRRWTRFYKVSPGLALWLIRNIKRFDVVHIHALFSFSSVAAGWTARLRGVPYIVRPLGTLARYGMTGRRPSAKRLSLRLIESGILRHAAAVHFTSVSEQAEAADLGVEHHGVVIPLGVEPCHSKSPAHDLMAAKSLARRSILFMSRIDPKKNVEGLLEAVALVRRNMPDVVLEICGAGPKDYMTSLHNLAQRLGLEGRVRWRGHVTGAQKASALAQAWIYALPSHSENFGIAPVEAMLQGIPCVLGRGVAIAADAERSGACIATDVRPPAIAAALTRLLSDDEARNAMGARARSFAHAEYSVGTMAARLCALYERIASRRGVPAQ